MPQVPLLRIGERGVREEHLPRIEAARVVALLLRPRAKEGDLESLGTIQPSGDVPPLAAEFGMRAMVARKFERSWTNDRVLHLPGPRKRREKRQCEKRTSLHYQSSRTARTGPMPIASLPETMAVATANTSKMTTSVVSRSSGGWSSMLQLNDCRLTT